jgi:hypothetical protein
MISYYTNGDVEIHPSARKHGIADEDILHGVANALASYALEEGDGEPRRTLVLGPDRSANLLEVVVLEFDDGGRLAIHAMRMRPKYIPLLPRP